MKPENFKLSGVVCLVVCGICLFIAVERYQTNASNVNAMRSLTQNMPMGGMFGEIKPATPAATKYALLFAIISGVAGVVCLRSGQQKSS